MKGQKVTTIPSFYFLFVLTFFATWQLSDAIFAIGSQDSTYNKDDDSSHAGYFDPIASDILSKRATASRLTITARNATTLDNLAEIPNVAETPGVDELPGGGQASVDASQGSSSPQSNGANKTAPTPETGVSGEQPHIKFNDSFVEESPDQTSTSVEDGPVQDLAGLSASDFDKADSLDMDNWSPRVDTSYAAFQDHASDKRYLDGLADALIKRTPAEYHGNADDSRINRNKPEKRYIDSLADTFIKKDDRNNKRYFDSLADAFIKKNARSSKRYVHSLSDTFIKKDDRSSKRYVDSLADGFIKKDARSNKRYVDSLADGFIKKDARSSKRYIDSLADGFIKKDARSSKRYIDSLADGFIKKDARSSKRYIDSLADGFIKKDARSNKRYIDSLADGFIKKDARSSKRYIDSLADGFIKKDVRNNKRYVDSLGDNFIKKDNRRNKRYVDSLGDSFIKKNDKSNKRYVDSLADNFIKKNDRSNKRYVDSLADNFIKKNDGSNKRYVDSLADNFIKRNDRSDKRYVDSLADNFIKRNDRSDKRYVDSLADNFIKRNDRSDKRYVDSLADNFIKRNDRSDKRYVDSLADNFIKRNDRSNKRYVDSLADNFIKRNDRSDKRYVDSLADNFIKRNGINNKRYVDSLADNFIKRNGINSKRYVDSLTDSFMKKEAKSQSRPPVAASTFDNKRYIDTLGGSMMKRQETENRRYMNSLAHSLTKSRDGLDQGYVVRFGRYRMLCRRRFVAPGMSLSGVQREQMNYCTVLPPTLPGGGSSLKDASPAVDKRAMEVTDDVMDGSRVPDIGASQSRKKRSVITSHFIDTTVASPASGFPHQRQTERDTIRSHFFKSPGQFNADAQSSSDTDPFIEEMASDLISKGLRNNRIQWQDGVTDSISFSPPKRYLHGMSSILDKRNLLDDTEFDSKKRYIDDVGSSLFRKRNTPSNTRKRYLDPLADSLFKRNNGQASWSPVSKRFSTLPSSGGQMELYVNALGRYTPFKRRTGSHFRLYNKGHSSPSVPGWSRRTWANNSPTLPVKKMPHSSSSNWEVRPTLMSVMMSPDRRPPVYGNTKSMLRQAMRIYLNDVNNHFLGSGTSRGYSNQISPGRYTSGKLGSRSRPRSRFDTPSSSASASSQDYFDSLAGNILQT